MRTTLTKTMIITAFALALAACDGGGGPDLGKFIGTWHPTAGAVTVTCPGQPSQSVPVSGAIVWSRGVSSDLVQTAAGDSCDIEADASGSTAEGHASPCTGADGGGGTFTLTITSYTFVVAPDGRTAQENETASYVDSAGGATVTCSLSGTASYQKVGS
jgi:hypothetical protein